MYLDNMYIVIKIMAKAKVTSFTK